MAIWEDTWAKDSDERHSMTQLTRICLATTMALLAGGLSASPTWGQETGTKEAAAKTLQTLQQAWKDGLKQWRVDQNEAIKKAQESDGPMPAIRMTPPDSLTKKHLAAFGTAAKQFLGQDGAIPFYAWILQFAPSVRDKQLINSTLETLTTVHLKSPALHKIPKLIPWSEKLIGKHTVLSTLKLIESENSDGSVKAAAILARIDNDFRRAKIDSEAYAYAKKEALRAAKLTKFRSVKAHVENTIRGREVVVKGKKAPDISGVDLDGVAFKLSDYRGKIILLDFWGDW